MFKFYVYASKNNLRRWRKGERERGERDYCLKRFYVNTNEYDINRNGSNNEHSLCICYHINIYQKVYAHLFIDMSIL